MSCTRVFIIASCLLIGCTKIHAEEKDSIFLYNGQVLIGEIMGGQFGEIMIDDIDLPDQQVKLYKIKRLNTARRFRIETSRKEILIGMIRSSAKDGWVNVRLDDSTVIDIELNFINTITALEKSFFKQLNGSLSAGFSYTKSSDEGQVNTSLSVQYIAERFQYQLSASANWSIDSIQFSRDREDASVLTAYSFKNGWFAAVGLSYQRNLELSIARRFQELVGGGNKIVVRKNMQLLAISGLTFNQERSTSGSSSGLLLEIPLVLRFNFFKYSHPNIQVTSSQSAYYSLSQKGRFRYDSNTSFSWELVRYFYLSINPYGNFDNQPPQGNSNFDFGVAVSITYKF